MMKHIAALLITIAVLFSLTACGNKPNRGADETNTAELTENVQNSAAEKPDWDAEKTNTAELTENAQNAAAEKPDRDAENTNTVELTEEEQDAWAKEIYSEAVQKLSDQGILTFNAEADRFEFEMDEVAHLYRPAITSEADAERLFFSDIALRGSTVLAFRSTDGTISVYGKTGIMADHDPHPEYPYFTPVFSNGTEKYQDVPIDAWAANTEDGACLIVYGGFEISRIENYYVGGADRVSTATLAIVIDMKAREVAHIECIGYDAPAAQTTHTTGSILYDEADAYISSLVPYIYR